MPPFNHHMLTLAREVRALTQVELADRLKLGQGTLSKYEAGILIPPGEVIDSFGDALGFPPSFFFEPAIPYGMPPFHYRRRRKLSAKLLGQIVAEMNVRRIHVKSY